MARRGLWIVGLLLSSCISGQAQGISPVLTQPPERVPSVKEEGVIAARPAPGIVNYGPQATIAVSDEIRRREQAATERWKQLRRERFIDDVSKLDEFAHSLAQRAHLSRTALRRRGLS